MDLARDIQMKPLPSAHVRDTGTEAFEADVLRASMEKPVVVYFWAAWSGPARQMMPLLEKSVSAASGTVAMLRVDIDAHPQLAQIFGVQSVPTVFAFFKGHPVDGFAGTKPEAELKNFVAKLVQLTADKNGETAPPIIDAASVAKFLAEADKFFRDGDASSAMERYGAVLELDPLNAPALAGIGWCLFAQGDVDSVREMAAHADDAVKNDPRMKGLSFILARVDEASTLPPLADIEKKIAAKPKDHQARYDLALRQMATGNIEGAVGSLVELTRHDREWQEQKARKLLVDLFDAMGPTHPQTAPGRRKLSSVLFS